MKTDRELMELAAKAAGIDAYWDEEYQRMQMDYHHKGGTNYEEWNPLTDDGDALRLAVKLNINVHKGFVYTPTGRLFDCRDYATPIGATRRAITRAAAAIGEGMK